jgi:hypothetical protein
VCILSANKWLSKYLPSLDPEVSTLTTLTNVQNSLFVPDLGRWINRRPTYTLSRAPSRPVEQRTQQAPPPPRKGEPIPAEEPVDDATAAPIPVSRTFSWQRRPKPERSHSISSVMTDSHYAVLPHGIDLDGWSEEDKEALDDHVRHMLHSRRSKFKQRMKAFGKYVSKRKFAVRRSLSFDTDFGSSGLRSNPICLPHHYVWSCLGSFPDRYDSHVSRQVAEY